ncbi:MAG: hypothetical protein ABEL76_04490 [Bradymonadaceae bacterium]
MVLGPANEDKASFLRRLDDRSDTDQSVDLSISGSSLDSTEIGCLSSVPLVPTSISTERRLRYYAVLRLPDLGPEKLSNRIGSVIDSLDLSDHTDVPPCRLAPGPAFRARLAAEVLIEPVVVLSPPAVATPQGIVSTAELDLETTVVSAPPPTEALLEHADRILVVEEGELRFEGDPETLLNRIGLDVADAGQIEDRLGSTGGTRRRRSQESEVGESVRAEDP